MQILLFFTLHLVKKKNKYLQFDMINIKRLDWIMKKFIYISIVFIIISFLFGCATVGSSIIMTGTKRPAIELDEVKIYLDPPQEYETIGLIEASAEVALSRQKAQDKAMNELRTKAANVGANGVLLVNSGSQSTKSEGYYSSGGVYNGGTSSSKIMAQARAIYVIRE